LGSDRKPSSPAPPSDDPVIGLVTETAELMVDLVETLRLKLSLKIGSLETQVTEMRGQITDLEHELKTLKAARGVSDGSQLPAAAIPPVRRQNGAPAVKRAGKTA
jgi:hypothetical protein